MKNIFFISFLCLFFQQTAFAQIERGDWIFGGRIDNYHFKQTTDGSVEKHFGITFEPSVGIFVVDRLTIGLQPFIKTAFFREEGVNPESLILAIGPFARFYFLNQEKIVNLFVDGSFNKGVFKTFISSDDVGKYDSYFSSIGVAAFFNKFASIEFSSGYWYQFTGDSSYHHKKSGLRATIGFKFHLTN